MLSAPPQGKERMSDPAPEVAALREGLERFGSLVAEIRPELHRYCARMTGSIFDGEDIVQETLAAAYYALSHMDAVPALRPWLFQIAHNRALNHVQRYERRMVRPLESEGETIADEREPADDALDREQAVRLAISRFVELPPAQRSAVILKDVLGHSLEEIGSLLELSVPAVKAALHRGRERLRALAASSPLPAAPLSAQLTRYATLFNARDWDALRAMLADDVRLDLLSRVQRSGRSRVSEYFTNYAKATDWRLVPSRVEGREMLAVFRQEGDARPSYFVELTFQGDHIALIRDYRYVPYIGRDAT
jgi:RNA polymerase sigma-70 factor (ECF subfamily)